MQDQAFLGPESGLAIPAEDGGVDLYIATQWLHVDQDQVAASLNLPPEKVRLTLSGVGGAFGAREDLSLQIHLCLLALRTGRPVKMVYSREESFFGHVHRHPARLRYSHGADRQGRLVFVKAEIVLDGGAYMSSSRAVVGNAGTLGVGPYEVPNVSIDAWGVYTNNPPCGAMRGFGAVQACFAYESQMDKLAEALGLHPVEVRARNAMTEGSVMPTGQVVDQPAPVAELLRRVKEAPLPEPAPWCPTCLSVARRGGQHDPRRGGGAGRRVRRRVQERRVLRGFRRLLDRPGNPQLRRRPSHRFGPHQPRARSGRGSSGSRRRSPAPNWPSNRLWWRRPTPGLAAPGRRPPPGRRT